MIEQINELIFMQFNMFLGPGVMVALGERTAEGGLSLPLPLLLNILVDQCLTASRNGRCSHIFFYCFPAHSDPVSVLS